MTREETVKIIRIMCDCYPNYKPSNLSETIDVWNMMLENCTYEQVSVALKAYVYSDTTVSFIFPIISSIVLYAIGLSSIVDVFTDVVNIPSIAF